MPIDAMKCKKCEFTNGKKYLFKGESTHAKPCTFSELSLK